jgi:transposase
MIPHGVDVFVCLEPIDLRWSFDRLSNLALERVGRDSRCGALFVFFGRRRDALKVLFFDGTGICQFYKRLDRGRFLIPSSSDEKSVAIAIDERILDDLLDGIDIDVSRSTVVPHRTRIKMH